MVQAVAGMFRRKYPVGWNPEVLQWQMHFSTWVSQMALSTLMGGLSGG
jgi:hypothetical protein